MAEVLQVSVTGDAAENDTLGNNDNDDLLVDDFDDSDLVITSEILHGGSGGDQINAGTDGTQAYGLAGNDTITSDGRNEVLLVGGAGDDSLVMTGGNGTLSGGTGSDTFELAYSATKKLSATIEDLNPTNDKIVVNFDGSSAPKLTTVTNGNDVVVRDSGGLLSVTLKGVRDNDYLDSVISDEIWDVLALTNAARQANNLPALTMADGLAAGASIRAQEITSLSEGGALTDHTRPDGTNFSTALRKNYSEVGENLDAGAASPAQAVLDWMNSPEHRENILNADYKKIGVGFNYKDGDISDLRYYWTQIFAAGLTDHETVSTADLSTASIATENVSKFITLTEGNDTYTNTLYSATIQALGGNDLIPNAKPNVSISGGDDNDTVESNALGATICAGKGDDSVRLSENALSNVIEYAAGDGNDTVSGFNETDTLSISGSEYTPATVGNDVVVGVGNDSITLLGAASLHAVNFDGTRSKLVILTQDKDIYVNTTDGTTIQALGGNDKILNTSEDIENNSGANVGIDGNAGNDFIENYGENVTVNGDAGDDTVSNYNTDVSIDGGEGNDSVSNSGIYVYDFETGQFVAGNSNVTINGGAGNDSISNNSYGANITINGDADNDYINNYGAEVSINGDAGNDSVDNNAVRVTIDGGEGNDSIRNNGDNVTIDGGADNDYINNYGAEVSINGGEGNDSIEISGITENITAAGSKGDDFIKVSGISENNLFHYAAGDGNDTIEGFNETDTLGIAGGDYSISTRGANLVLKVGTSSITLLNMARQAVNINGEIIETGDEDEYEDRNIVLSDEPDVYRNSVEGATIQALGGEDSVRNDFADVYIYGDDDDDTVDNSGDNVTINGGYGNDSIENDGDNVTVDGGAGDDQINLSGNAKNNVIEYLAGYWEMVYDDEIEDFVDVLISGNGNDTVNGFNETDTLVIYGVTGGCSNLKSGNNIIVKAGTDTITLADAANLSSANIEFHWGEGSGEGNRITLSESNDYYTNEREDVTIAALGGDNSISNSGYNVTISSGAGNDSIFNNWGDLISIDAGDGNDTIENAWGYNMTIRGGKGNDRISLSSDGSDNVIEYASGDGNDTVWGLRDISMLKISASSYSSAVSGDDVIFTVGDGSVTLKNARRKPSRIVLGEGNTSGGTSNSGGNNSASGGNNSASGAGNSSGGGQTGGGTNAGGSSNSGSSSGNSGTSSNGNSTSGGRGGNSFRFIRNEHSTTANAPTVTASAETPLPLATPSTSTTTQRVYTGGNQVIANYASGEKIIFGAQYTGAFYDGNGNFFAGSTTGALVVQNATDKVIDLTDAAGNSFVKAYAATTAGVIDGRGLSGFEVINGSAGGDVIYAGDGGSQLWGGADVATDMLVGGNGTDIFIGGRTQGADYFLNASSTDVLHLNDSTLSDIVATAEENGTIGIAFNTGNVIAVQSSEALSAAVMLADGSAYRYNHATRNWQSA